MKAISCSLKFAAGSLSNLACQAVRCLLNLVGSILSAAAALALAALGLLQLAGGGREQAWRTLSLSRSWACGSALMAFFSLLQGLGIASLATPLIRGAQACTERLSVRGIYAPYHPSLNIWQRAFGLNSWSAAPEKPTKGIPQTKARCVERQARSPREKKVPEMRVVRKKQPKHGWISLATAHLSAKTQEERDATRAAMALRHPVLYLRTLRAAAKALGKKKAA